MRKNWMEPQIEVQQFMANEYVAACGDSGVVYNFECTAGGGVSGRVYLETNGVSGLQTEGSFDWKSMTWIYRGDESLGGYHACNIKHEAESTNPFLDGYYVPNNSGSVIPVVVWRGPYDNNTHCTEKLNKNQWETAKS